MIIRIGIGILCLSLTVSSAASATPTPALMLSPLIKQDPQQARTASLVDSTLFLNITSHAGFLTVDEKHNSNIYFWYLPVAEKPVNVTPWIIWLQGGPGASSLTGLFEEIGPFQYLGGQLNRRQWSWANNYSLLFVDNPVGAGFSFTNSEDGFVHNMEECSTHLYSALQQFLTIFPELRSAPLYIAGESYAGRYIPAFGYKILEEQPAGNAAVNLTGLMMGNPVIDRNDIVDLSSVYYHWGLLDSQGLLATKPLQDRYRQAVEQNKSDEAWTLHNELEDWLHNISQHTSPYNLLENSSNEDGVEPRFNEFEALLHRPEIAEALHVGDIRFTYSNQSVQFALKKDFLGPIKPKLEKLLEHYKVMIYCGQLDLIAPCELSADARRKRWRWSRRDDFLKAPRRPWVSNGTIAGYVKEGGGLTEVLVQGAGHLVLMDAPEAARALLAYFVSGDELRQTIHFKNKPEYTPIYVDELPLPPAPNEPTVKKSDALIASVVLNVLLLLCLIGSVLLYMRYKRRSEAFFYSTVEDSISDGILTMT